MKGEKKDRPDSKMPNESGLAQTASILLGTSQAKIRREELCQLLGQLNEEDLAWLSGQLAQHQDKDLTRDSLRIGQQELLAAETKLREKLDQAEDTRERRSRLRAWLIFMLLRYGALRLVEIFALGQEHFDLANGWINVPGQFARQIPLPADAWRRIRLCLLESHSLTGMNELLRCDASHVRRSLARLGASLHLPPGLLSVRNIRHSRAIELARQGMPLPVLDFFLGRRTIQGLVHCDGENARQIITKHVRSENVTKTSARNVFVGRIISLRQAGLLVDVTITTAGGLRVSSLITDESYRNLGLVEGMLINASVKAPWVLVSKAGGTQGAENSYQAVVEQIRNDDVVTEILASLPDGSLICALQTASVQLATGGGQTSESLAPGDRVTVCFKAFSVILGLN